MYRMRGLRLVRTVLLPASLPAYFTGFANGIRSRLDVRSRRRADGRKPGIGYLLLEGENNGRPALILAAMLIFALAGKSTDLALVAISRRALRWEDTVANR